MLFVIARLSLLPLSPVVDMGGNEARWASSSWVLQYALAASTSSSEVYLIKPAYGGRTGTSAPSYARNSVSIMTCILHPSKIAWCITSTKYRSPLASSIIPYRHRRDPYDILTA